MKSFNFTGHDLLAVERFRDDTSHMVEFIVCGRQTGWGVPGSKVRLFLNQEGYRDVLEARRRGELRITRHADVIEGHILPERRRKHRR